MSACTCTWVEGTVYDDDPIIRRDWACPIHGDAAQPLPVGNNLPIAHRMVQADLDARLALGVERYGQPLQPHNGRNSLRDAYEEALDLCVYLRNALYEQEHPQ